MPAPRGTMSPWRPRQVSCGVPRRVPFQWRSFCEAVHNVTRDSMNEVTPKSPAEEAAALEKLIEELTGFIGIGETRRSANVINLKSREDMLDRLAYYRGWMSEGTFPKLTLYVLDATTGDVRFPHLMILTGPLNEN